MRAISYNPLLKKLIDAKMTRPQLAEKTGFSRTTLAKILFELTRNTGFEVSKGAIGDCWIKDCCDYSAKTSEDECGLDDGRLTIEKKMKSIYEGTSLREELKEAGLEVSPS